MSKINTYRITKKGPSHYGRSKDGHAVRYNADPKLGTTTIKLTGEQAASGKYDHLGLVLLGVSTTEQIVEKAVRDSEPKQLVTNPAQPAPTSSDTPESKPKVDVPKNWQALPKARRAAIVRVITGKNAVSWSDDELNKAIQDHVDGIDSNSNGS